MVCIYCESPTEVKNSRLKRQNNHIWRRRACMACGSIFTTREHATLSESYMVKTGSSLMPFIRDRLFLTIYESCKHRPNAIAETDALTQTIINQLARLQERGVVERDTIVQQARLVLGRFDPTAATFYAAYHK